MKEFFLQPHAEEVVRQACESLAGDYTTAQVASEVMRAAILHYCAVAGMEKALDRLTSYSDELVRGMLIEPCFAPPVRRRDGGDGGAA